MNIILHWWMVPILFALAGVFFFVKAERATDACLGGVLEMFISLTMFAVAAAVCLGHWL